MLTMPEKRRCSFRSSMASHEASRSCCKYGKSFDQGWLFMKTPQSFRHLRIALVWVLSVLVLGTTGYMLIENLPLADALYTTISMMSTVGTVVRPLSFAGRLWTIGVIVVGVGSLFYTFGVVMEFFIEGHFSEQIRKRFMEKKIARLHYHYLVCGFGRVGSQIVEELVAAHQPFVIIDEQESNLRTCSQRGYLVLLGDATSDALLREAGIGQAKGVLVATDNDAHNISVTLSARHLNKDVFIVARANHDETKAKLELAGANRIISPYAMAGHRMASLAIEPGVVECVEMLTKAGSVEFAVEEVIISPTSLLVGKTLAEAQNTLRSRVMIVALKKPSGLIASQRSEARIEAGDIVIIVGAPDQLTAFQHNNTARS
jgi:voltage-gated potassium channel